MLCGLADATVSRPDERTTGSRDFKTLPLRSHQRYAHPWFKGQTLLPTLPTPFYFQLLETAFHFSHFFWHLPQIPKQMNTSLLLSCVSPRSISPLTPHCGRHRRLRLVHLPRPPQHTLSGPHIEPWAYQSANWYLLHNYEALLTEEPSVSLWPRLDHVSSLGLQLSVCTPCCVRVRN